MRTKEDYLAYLSDDQVKELDRVFHGERGRDWDVVDIPPLWRKAIELQIEADYQDALADQMLVEEVEARH